MTLEEIIRRVLAQAVKDGLMRRRFLPASFNSGDLAGCANVLGECLDEMQRSMVARQTEESFKAGLSD